MSKEVPPGAIEAANDRVLSRLKPASAESSRKQDAGRGTYMKVNDAQRYCIGKRAAQFGTTVAMKYVADKYPNDPQFASLKETTVRRWKDQYKAASLLKDGGSDDDLQSQERQEPRTLPEKDWTAT